MVTIWLRSPLTRLRRPRSRRAQHGWRDVVASLREPRVLAQARARFLRRPPFLLTGNTLGCVAATRKVPSSRQSASSRGSGSRIRLKFVWAPLLDRVELPLLGRLGKRRSWIVLAQRRSRGRPRGDDRDRSARTACWCSARFAVVVAFASATQDIAIDAWRIESSRQPEELGLMSAAYQLGYRVAIRDHACAHLQHCRAHGLGNLVRADGSCSWASASRLRCTRPSRGVRTRSSAMRRRRFRPHPSGRCAVSTTP